VGKRNREINKGRKEAGKFQCDDPELEPDWEGQCEVCGQSPVVPLTGMCGPCTFGAADTIGGNW
jgi:hypothetical protein